MQAHKLISKSGVAAGLACAAIPLAVTGLLLFRHAAKTGSADELLIWTFATFFAFFPAQLIFAVKVNRYDKQRLAGDDAPPTQALKLLYGAALGMMASGAGLMLALLWVYFTM